MGLMQALFAPVSSREGLAPIERSLENPQTKLSDPDEWLYDALGGGASAAGVRVNRKTSLTYAAFWRAVNIISDTTAKIPIHIYRRQGEGKTRDVDHPGYPLLRHKPNPYMTAETFKRVLTSHKVVKGNGYAYIERDGGARPMGLYILDPESTYPLRVNGVLGYITHDSNGREVPLRADQVFHLKGLGWDGLVGYSVLEYARDSMGLGMTIVQFQSRTFRNSARPAVTIQFPAGVKLTPEAAEKLRTSWERLYGGVDNTGRTAVLMDGAEAKPLSFNAKDSQLIESAQQGVRDVSNWTGVPPHKLGDQTRNAYNSLEQENQSFLDDTMDPIFVCWEEEARDKLLTEEQKRRDTHVIEFKRQALVRADLAARGNFYKAAVGGPIMTPDEARGLENLNPMPDGQGAKLYPPQGTSNIEGAEEGGEAGKTPAPKPTKPAPSEEEEKSRLDALHRELISEAVERVVKRVGAQARRAGKDAAKFEEFLSTGIDRHAGPAGGIMALPVKIRSETTIKRDGTLAVNPAQEILSRIRSGLDAVYSSVTPEKFAAAIDDAMTDMENDLPAEIAAKVIGGQRCDDAT